jgi:SPP1 gp7 family putative phage head morphogenesis protein
MPPSPEDFDRAEAWFRARISLPDEDFGADVEELVRGRAFRIAGITQFSLVSDVWQALDDAIAKGETLEDFKAKVGDKLAAAWGGDNPHRVETIFRNWVQTAYSAGREEMMHHPAVKPYRPYARYVATLDARTTEICRPIHGTVLPLDDPWWHTHTPPLHHRCRGNKVSLTEEQAREYGVTPMPPPAAPSPGFGLPPQFPSEPDLSKYPPELLNVLAKKQAA